MACVLRYQNCSCTQAECKPRYTNHANLLCPVADGSNPLTGSPIIGKCTVSISALSIPDMVNNYWSNNRGASAGSAFTAVPESSFDAAPMGLIPLLRPEPPKCSFVQTGVSREGSSAAAARAFRDCGRAVSVTLVGDTGDQFREKSRLQKASH
jgi:hypothetical protein